ISKQDCDRRRQEQRQGRERNTRAPPFGTPSKIEDVGGCDQVPDDALKCIHGWMWKWRHEACTEASHKNRLSPVQAGRDERDEREPSAREPNTSWDRGDRHL